MFNNFFSIINATQRINIAFIYKEIRETIQKNKISLGYVEYFIYIKERVCVYEERERERERERDISQKQSYSMSRLRIYLSVQAYSILLWIRRSNITLFKERGRIGHTKIKSKERERESARRAVRLCVSKRLTLEITALKRSHSWSQKERKRKREKGRLNRKGQGLKDDLFLFIFLPLSPSLFPFLLFPSCKVQKGEEKEQEKKDIKRR